MIHCVNTNTDNVVTALHNVVQHVVGLVVQSNQLLLMLLHPVGYGAESKLCNTQEQQHAYSHGCRSLLISVTLE